MVSIPVFLPIAVYLLIYLLYRMPSELGPIPDGVQDEVMGYLRQAVQQGTLKPGAPGTELRLPGPGWVTLYHQGDLLFRHCCIRQTTLAACIEDAGRAIVRSPTLQHLDSAQRHLLRIKVDLTAGQGPILSSVPLFFAKSVVPGLDGIGLHAGDKAAYLLPDDLFKAELLSGYKPFWFMDEFKTGLNLKKVVTRLADELDLSAEEWKAVDKQYFRFRVRAFVEAPEGSGRAMPVKRSRVPVYRIDQKLVREAVERAADYVLRQIEPDGRFRYIYYPLADRHSPPGGYNLPRHAGTTWFLSLAYRHLRHERYGKAARKAINYLGANAVPRGCRSTPFACVGSDRYASLGSAGLAVVAIVEYQQATGDRRFEPLARKLGKFILEMQKPNGDFCHQYTPRRRKKNCQDILLYYSGEAALALAGLLQLTGDQTYRAPLERALDFLTDGKYDFFLGQFFISEDHWTCIAAEAAFPHVAKDQYAQFCYAFARLNARAQVQPDEGLAEDLVGAFNITPWFMPHNTPAGSRSEANVATYLLSDRRSEPQPDILRTVRLTVRYLVDQQIRPESAYLLPNPRGAIGGMMQTPMRASIRIDYVQHAAAAMVRALPLIPIDGWSADPS